MLENLLNYESDRAKDWPSMFLKIENCVLIHSVIETAN